ncbi:MAG: thioredoxin domain-containing protein [Bryobacteraceae bacterium]|nr:thioredoxin domain-containing protein [Bryobacteraceae bacterium]
MKALFSTSFLVIGSMFAGAAVQAAEKAVEARPLAEVDGVKLTRAEFERRYVARLFQARNNYHESERKALDDFIEQYLIERAAQKEGLTVEKLMEKHVTSKVPADPSEEALRVYFEGVETQESYESVKGKIVDALRARRAGKLRMAYLAKLKSEANITLMLAPPRANLSMKDVVVRGPQDAPVTLVEYADYECPYCVQIQPVLERLEKEYKGRLAFVYKDAPLPMHGSAQKAAEATQCAAVQGKYWELHDMLLAKKMLDVPSMKEFARTLKMDGAAFDKCLDNGDKAAFVKASLDEAQTMGVQGTPSFFINGRAVNGGPSYERLKEVIEEELSNIAAQKK